MNENYPNSFLGSYFVFSITVAHCDAVLFSVLTRSSVLQTMLSVTFIFYQTPHWALNATKG